jgi:predicted metalloprotease with PDZ domain
MGMSAKHPMNGLPLFRLKRLCPLVVLAFAFFPFHLTAQQEPMTVVVDTRGSTKKLFHSELAIPVHAGPLTLLYPRWGIPTYRMPDAAIDDIVWLRMTANGRAVEWKRDPVDMFAFHVVVPEDAKVLNVAMDVVAPSQRSDLNAATADLFILDWYTLVLYPQGTSVRDVPVVAAIQLPNGWKYGTTLNTIGNADGVIKFAQVSLWTLLDSPILAGKYFRSFELRSPSVPPVFVDVAADSAEVTEVQPEWRERFRRLITEAGALFGGYPYASYHFQIALSDEVGNDGLEHRESTDLRMSPRSLLDSANRLSWGYLIPHEYAHAWNGLYRIPAGLVRRDFQEPQTTELLWVYEGLTRYLNWVLAARSGILTTEEARDYVALLAAQVAHRSGREWRSLQDTAVSAGILNDAPDQWQSLRRGTDYYDESLFIWLEADSIIRRVTNGNRSMDDFCRAFFATDGRQGEIAPYTFDEVAATLNAVAPYDWKAFLRTRLDMTGPDRAPLDGLTASGWDLVYGDVPNRVQVARDKVRQMLEERFSLGLLLADDGAVIDVVRDSPAWKAGLGPYMKVLAINGQAWSPQNLRQAIGIGDSTVRLTMRNGSQTWQAEMKAQKTYPTLKRNGNRDTLSEILKPIRRSQPDAYGIPAQV